MFLDPPFLLTSSFYANVECNDVESFFNLLKNINTVNSKLCVCCDHFLLKCFY